MAEQKVKFDIVGFIGLLIFAAALGGLGVAGYRSDQDFIARRQQWNENLGGRYFTTEGEFLVKEQFGPNNGLGYVFSSADTKSYRVASSDGKTEILVMSRRELQAGEKVVITRVDVICGFDFKKCPNYVVLF